MDLKGNVVLVTGASQGIGRCLAVDFAKRGATVVGCGRSRERLEETLALMRGAGPASTVIVCDVGERAQVRAMIDRTLADFGGIDILINNAGIGSRRPFAETSLDPVEEIMRVNFLGTVYCTHAVLPSMISRGRGHIVAISSVAGQIGTPNMAAYCASKFAMNGFCESLYHELRPRGIHVSVISPGPVKTDFSRSFADIPPKSPANLAVAPEAVSRAVIRAIARRQAEVVVPGRLAPLCWLKRVAPNLFRTAAGRIFRSAVVGKARHGI